MIAVPAHEQDAARDAARDTAAVDLDAAVRIAALEPDAAALRAANVARQATLNNERLTLALPAPRDGRRRWP